MIGFMVIVGLYLVASKKEQVKSEIEQQKKEQQRIVEKQNAKKKQEAEISKLKKDIQEAYQNRDMQKLQELRKVIIQKKYTYDLISKNEVEEIINDTEYKIKELNKLNQKDSQQKQLEKLKKQVQIAYQNNDISELKRLQMQLSYLESRYPLIADQVNEENEDIYNKIREIRDNQASIKENLKKFCVRKYEELEKRYQDAIGVFNDNEDEITSVKSDAKLLKDKCKEFNIVNDIEKLIRKCDNELE